MATQEKIYSLVKLFVTIKCWTCNEGAEGTTKRLDIQHGQTTGIAKIHSTGTLQPQGPDSEVKAALLKLKSLLEPTHSATDLVLIQEIKDSLVQLNQKLPNLDLTIAELIDQSMICLEANSLPGCAILIGCASERAIWLMIDSYAQAISDKSNRERFIQNTRSKSASQVYEIFKQSTRSCKSKPQIDRLVHDWQTQVDALFNFFRICRNEIGHPIVPPSIDRGSLLANLGQFIKYIEVIYKLIGFFRAQKIVL